MTLKCYILTWNVSKHFLGSSVTVLICSSHEVYSRSDLQKKREKRVTVLIIFVGFAGEECYRKASQWSSTSDRSQQVCISSFIYFYFFCSFFSLTTHIIIKLGLNLNLLMTSWLGCCNFHSSCELRLPQLHVVKYHYLVCGWHWTTVEQKAEIACCLLDRLTPIRGSRLPSRNVGAKSILFLKNFSPWKLLQWV